MDQKEQIIFDKIRPYFQESPEIVDIGGYIGNWTNEVISKIPNSNLTIFEPNQENFNKLLIRYKDYKNIKLINKAVGDDNTKGSYFDLKVEDGRREMSGFINRPIYQGISTEVVELDIITFDSLEINNIIDFIKIDVEGYELNVFKGMSNFLEKRMVKFIQFEYGGTYKDANYSLNDVILHLNKYGYGVYDLDENNNFIEIKNYDDDYNYNNFIAYNQYAYSRLLLYNKQR